jgi:hypothetical protein
LQTSAIRKSRSEFAAVSTAFFRRILPRGRARTDDFSDSINARLDVRGHDSCSSGSEMRLPLLNDFMIGRLGAGRRLNSGPQMIAAPAPARACAVPPSRVALESIERSGRGQRHNCLLYLGAAKEIGDSETARIRDETRAQEFRWRGGSGIPARSDANLSETVRMR